jgi:site-specific DNA recombinase
MKPTAWLYLRVSSQGQVGRAFSEEGYSIEAQRADGHRKAAQLEAEITEEFVDPAETATNANRPALKRLLASLRTGEPPTYVIVHKVDRFARNRRDDANMLFEIMESGAELVSATESIDGTPSGRLTHGILASIAEYYSLNLSAEVKKGLHGKARVGGTPGYVRIGYLNVGKVVEGREVRTVEIDPNRGPHISWAFTAFATGAYTLDTIQAALKRRGLRTRSTRKQAAHPLSRSQIARLLRSKYYIGIVPYNGVEHEGRHEPLIDKTTFDQVQRVLDAHSHAQERDRKHSHFLKGSLRCHCGERISFVKGRSKTGRVYDYFACLGRKKGTGCKLPYLPAHEVEEKVAAAYSQVKVRQLGEDATDADWRLHLEDVRAATTQALVGLRKLNEGAVRRHRARITSLEAKREKFLEAFYADALPADLLRSEQDKIAAEMDEAKRQLAEAEADVTGVADAFNRTLDAVGCMVDTYREARDIDRRLWNQALFECFRVYPDEEIGGELREEIRALTDARTPRRLRADCRRRVSSGRGWNKSYSAEREGFEPSRELAPPTRLAGECLQPLGHLSGSENHSAGSGIRRS